MVMQVATNENTQDRCKLSKEYEKIRLRFFFLQTALSFAVLGIFALAGPSEWLAKALNPWVGSGILAAIVFTTLCLTGYALVFLPLDYLGGFRLEHRFHLSNQQAVDWGKDELKSFGLKIVMANGLAVALLAILRGTGEGWWIWAGCIWLLFGILLSHLFPILILPLFFKIAPIQDDALKQRIFALAQKVKVKIVGVYQFDMSRKTKKANAMFTGLGKTKRIILGDTLLEKFQPEEIEVILAHEMGHYVHGHIVKQIAASTAMTFLGLWFVQAMLRAWAGPLGYAGLGEIAILPLIVFLLSIMAFLCTPLSNGYSRYCERQADRFALSQTGNTQAFCSSMQKLAQQNLSNANPHPAIEFFLYSHPSIAKRIRSAEDFALRRTA